MPNPVIDFSGIVDSGKVEFDAIGEPTYYTAQDYLNMGSVGIIEFTGLTDNGDGTVTVPAGSGIIKASDELTADSLFFDWEENDSIAITDNTTSYVYIDYNSGSPIVSSTTNPIALTHTTQFVIGVVNRNGINLHIAVSGQYLVNFKHDVLMQKWLTNPVQIALGCVPSEAGTRNIAVTSGVIYFILTQNAFSAKDTSATDVFVQQYRDGVGGWTEVYDETQISNTKYDDGDGNLEDLTGQHYGVHWIFAIVDEDQGGHLHVVVGQGNYKLAEAQASLVPGNLPSHISVTGVLIGKVIIQNGASSFYSIEAPTSETSFIASSDHGALAGLDDDDHTQYTLRSDWLQNGFEDKDDVSISWDDASRTLTIQPAVSTFNYFLDGVMYSEDSTITEVIDDTEGLWAIYIDAEDSMAKILNPSDTQIDSLVEDECFVAYVYWDATNKDGRLLFELHGYRMSPSTHHWLHDNIGSIYRSGMALSDFNVDDDGDTNNDAQFSVSSGRFYDEDIEHVPSAVAAVTGLEIWYLVGSDWRWTTNAGFSVLTTGTGRMAFNDSGSQTEVTNNNFVLCHVLATNVTADDGTEPKYITVQGQVEYSTLGQARDGAETEINTLVFGTLPLQEVVPVGTVIFQTSNNYDNDVKGRVRTTDAGDNYVDWRSSNIKAAGGSVSDHGSLAGLSDDDHTQYLLADGTRNIAGNITQDDALYIATDEVRARDGDGLKIHNDGGAGIFIDDNNDIMVGNVVVAGPASSDGIVIKLDTSTTLRQLFMINKLWTDSTDATRTGKVTFRVSDYNVDGGRIFFRGEADGTEAKISFFGASAQTRKDHIVDADGSLADITTKFNTLLSYLEDYGLIKKS